MPEYTCLWCTINPVSEEGEVCSYDCYGAWIRWHQLRNGMSESDLDIVIKVEEGMTILLPLELQSFYQETWKDI